MDIDTTTASRPGLRLTIFALLLLWYPLLAFFPVCRYSDGRKDRGYILGHHAFVCGFKPTTRNTPFAEKPHQLGLLVNVLFATGMAMLFRGELYAAAVAGAIATGLASLYLWIGPEFLRPCTPAEVLPFFQPGPKGYSALPPATGPFLLGYYLWLATVALLVPAGLTKLVTPRKLHLPA